MATYILLSRHLSGLTGSDEAVSVMSERIVRRVDAECTNVSWQSGYALLGPYDYLDIFEAPDAETAAKVAFLIRTHADVETEIWAATSRGSFEDMVSDLESGGVTRATGGSGKSGGDEDMGDVAEADRESFPASDPPAYTGTRS